MFGIGFSEIIVIGICVILFIKPQDIPGLLRSWGKFYGELRKLYLTFMREINLSDHERDTKK